MLTVLHSAGTLVGGFAAAYLSIFFVALTRMETEAPGKQRSGTPTRVAATTLIALAVLMLIPQIVLSSAVEEAGADTETLIIGHRGYVAHAVENSIEGLEAAAEAGADMVEIDIQETADAQFAVTHDASMGRMAGDSRNVRDITMAELGAMTITQDAFTSHVSSMAEYVAAADALGMRLLIEVKPTGHEQEGFVERFAAELDGLDPDGTHMVQSLSRPFVEAYAPLAGDRDVAFVVGFQLGGLPATPANTVALEDWSYADAQLYSAHEQGKAMFIWTLNEAGLIKDYLDRGVDGIITDRVTTAIELREAQATGSPLSRYVDAAFRSLRPY